MDWGRSDASILALSNRCMAFKVNKVGAWETAEELCGCFAGSFCLPCDGSWCQRLVDWDAGNFNVEECMLGGHMNRGLGVLGELLGPSSLLNSSQLKDGCADLDPSAWVLGTSCGVSKRHWCIGDVLDKQLTDLCSSLSAISLHDKFGGTDSDIWHPRLKGSILTRLWCTTQFHVRNHCQLMANTGSYTFGSHEEKESLKTKWTCVCMCSRLSLPYNRANANFNQLRDGQILSTPPAVYGEEENA